MDSKSDSFSRGQIVKHSALGKGTLTRIDEEGRIWVRFENPVRVSNPNYSNELPFFERDFETDFTLPDEKYRLDSMDKTMMKQTKKSTKVSIKISKKDLTKSPPLKPAKIIEKNNSIQILQYFYHITHLSNLDSILAYGIYSHDQAHRKSGFKTDISNQDVQWRRHHKMDPIFNRKIDEYACLYVNPRNAMLYVIKNNADKLCILMINPNVINSRDHIYTDGNAASIDTSFGVTPDIISPIEHILKSQYWSDYSDGKRASCAEVLCYPSISSKFIDGIIVKHLDLAKQISNRTKLNIYVDPSAFYA